MKQVVIYPGRFQPMLSHHAEVYKQLQSQFPEADVYVGTSDKVEGDKSPFNFKEKQMIAQAHGIDPNKVLLAKRPYHKDDYPFDEDNTVIIFAVGEKDLDRFPFNNVDPKTKLDMTVRGEPKPKYYQKINTYRTDPKPMAERGYITLAPTVKTGDEVASASAFRQAFKNAPDSASAKEIFLKQFGEYDQKVFDLIYDKIKGTEMSEELNILRKLAGMEPIAEAPVQMPDFDKGERPKNAKEREAYRKWKQSQSASAKVDDESPLPISAKDRKAAAERPAKAAAADPMAVGFTKIKPEDMTDKRSGKPIPSKQRQKSVANQFPADADINDPAVKKEVFLKLAAKRPDLMFGEINARLANDDEGLAASDRLSPIVRELEDTRNLMDLDPEDKKFALRLMQNAIDNMEMVRATDIDKAIDVEPMQLDVDDDEMEPEIGDDEMVPVLDPQDDEDLVRDSVNFDDIRAEYDIVPEGKMKDIVMDLQDMSKEEFCSKHPEHADDYEDLCKQYEIDEAAIAEKCAQCGMEDCPCEPGECDCEPVAGHVPAEESAPFAEPSQQDEAYERLQNAYEQGGEEGLCKEAGCTLEELDQEINEICRDKGLHPDDDRDECIQIYIEDLVDNADYKDHGEYESVEEVIEDAIEETTDNALASAMAELRSLAGIN